jgi:peroxiredoxin
MSATIERLLTKRIGWVGIFMGLAMPVALFGQDAARPAAKPLSTQKIEEMKYEEMYPTLAIGASAPDFSLVDTHGVRRTLADYKKFPILLIVFTCNHCPWAQQYEDRIQELDDDYRPKGVAVVAVNPNANLAMTPSEFAYSDVDDSLNAMAIRMKLRHLTYPWLYDGDTESMSKKYGPKTTPHVFIFDKERKLQFQGRIDNSMHLDEVKTHDTRDALDQMLAGKPVAVQHTPTFGCNTKWAGFIPEKQQAVTDWNAKPVTVDDATADVLKQVRANSSGKLLMVSFWSTKCVSCMAAFPEVVQSYTWYSTRHFDLITVSADGPSRRAAVQKFLQDQHSAVRNLQFASTDAAGLQQAFAGKSWDPREPYIVLIDPSGNVVYEHAGKENVLQVRRLILANLSDKGNFRGNAAYWANNFKLGEATAGATTKAGN